MTDMDKSLTHQFRLVSQRKVEEIKAEIYMYEHAGTRTPLMFVKTDDTNKVFNISFKTPPHDSTGCPHILEHSVLNGSKHFPSRNTFSELMKGSMYTFLNAFTASDCTSYPIASTNDKDYMNLMHVYLDAVFCPNIYDTPNILKQEGWHHELFNKEDDIIYKGVVYNEMKGALASADALMMHNIQQVQNPDTPYSCESGGNPVHIPELDWEMFKAFHSKYYHPSNSRIFLYGDVDIEAALAFIDTNYLSKFSYLHVDSEIPLQQPFPQPKEVERTYPVAADENADGKNYVSFSYTFGKVTEVEQTAALNVLKQILMDSPASPLKQAIQDSNLTEDAYATVNDNILQPCLSIVCKHVKTENIPALKKLIYTELQRLVAEGIDKKTIEAVINSREFFLREADLNHYPKGLFHNMVSLNNWLHGGDPERSLAFEHTLAYLRQGLTTPLYEDLISQAILNNPHASMIVMKPEAGLIEKREAETKKKLAAYKASLTDEQLDALIADNQQLLEWQSAPEKPEDLAVIPGISVCDLSTKAEELPLEEHKENGITYLHHPLFTNGIIYVKAFYDLSHIPAEELPWLSLLTDLVGSMNTSRYSYSELANEIDIHTGGISLDISTFAVRDSLDTAQVKLTLFMKSTKAKVQRMVELAQEYAYTTDFSDHTRLSQLIRELKSRLQRMIMWSSHSIAIRRMLAQQLVMQQWNDQMEGLAYYDFISSLIPILESNPSQISDKLSAMLQKSFSRQNLIISITSPEEDIVYTRKHLASLIESLPASHAIAAANAQAEHIVNEGITAPIDIMYVAQGGIYSTLGYQYNGSMKVLANILRNDFLMQELRVKGGAYGIILLFSRNGYLYFCSYRDPNLTNTLDVYSQIHAYLESFTCSQKDFEKYIIGTMSELEHPKTASQKGYTAACNYIEGYTNADEQKLRDDILGTRIETIRSYAAMIQDTLKEKHICVFGNAQRIQENSNLFDVVIPAIKQ